MKKKLVIEIISFVIVEITLLLVSVFMTPPAQTIIIVLAIALPIGMPIVILIIEFWERLYLHPLNESVDYNKPLAQDRNAFLKAQPFFCDDCKKFSDIFRDYCEYCGTKNSLRKATKQDFE